jgi:thioredoxin 1
MVQHVSGTQPEELISSGKTVFCDFWATWCGPCRMLAPVFEELANEFEGRAEFVKVDVDENEDAARKYGITSIPNIILFKGGEKVANSLGFLPKEQLKAFILSNL